MRSFLAPLRMTEKEERAPGLIQLKATIVVGTLCEALAPLR
jgi:hypothetical protein